MSGERGLEIVIAVVRRRERGELFGFQGLSELAERTEELLQPGGAVALLA